MNEWLLGETGMHKRERENKNLEPCSIRYSGQWILHWTDKANDVVAENLMGDKFYFSPVSQTAIIFMIIWVSPGPWQRNFIDARFLQFHIVSGHLELHNNNWASWTLHRGSSESDDNFRKLNRTICCTHYASAVTHTVFENIKRLHSALCQNKKGPVASLSCLFPGLSQLYIYTLNSHHGHFGTE